MRARIALAAFGSVVSTIAIAQRSPDIAQISAPVPTVVVQEVTGDKTTGATQVSPRSDTEHAPSQLTPTGDGRRGTTQVASGKRNVQAPSPLSRPADGRIAAVDRVSGTDRCDPAAPKRKASTDCSWVIEARSTEFARPALTELSPEQKLLLEQQITQGGEGVVDATRRLARSGNVDSSPEAAAIATVVLGGQQPAEKPKKEEPAPDAALQAVINFLQTTPQQ
jgi:hypothetical protein